MHKIKHEIDIALYKFTTRPFYYVNFFEDIKIDRFVFFFRVENLIFLSSLALRAKAQGHGPMSPHPRQTNADDEYIRISLYMCLFQARPPFLNLSSKLFWCVLFGKYSEV